MILAVIPARGGSKGIPRKNLAQINGKSLLEIAITCAKSCPSLEHIFVSTEDTEIASVAKSVGADVPFLRDISLAQDTTSTLAVLKDLLPSVEQHYGKRLSALVVLDACAPLRLAEDVENALKSFLKEPCDLVVSGSASHRNPYFNMVQMEDGWAKLVIPPPDPQQPITRRQDAPEVFDLNTVVWIFSRACVERGERLPKKTRLYIVPKERSIDLDQPRDLELLRVLMSPQAPPSRS